jgi:hypothetical protein
MEEYSVKLNKYYKYVENNMYILEVEKLCGYSEFVLVYKNSSITDVCNSIFQHFECSHKENKRVFVTKIHPACTTHTSCDNSENSEVTTTPMNIEDCIVLSESHELFRNFVNNNSEYFRPIYDLPCKVVYKIYLDDGHCNNNA